MSGKTRLDLLLSTEDDNGKKRYTKVGSAWVSTDRDGNPTVSIAIDAGVSVSTPKNTYLNGYVPRERDQQRPQGKSQRGTDDDNLPF